MTAERERGPVHPQLADLTRRLRLRPALSAPPELIELLLSNRGGPFSSADRGDAWSGWRRRLSWAAAVVPAAAVAVVLPMSLAPAPAMRPTHAPTPCTLDLVVGHAPGRG